MKLHLCVKRAVKTLDMKRVDFKWTYEWQSPVFNTAVLNCSWGHYVYENIQQL